MGDARLPIESSARVRSRIALVAALLLLALALADALRSGPALTVTLGARLVWVVALLGASRALLFTDPRRTEWVAGACFMVSLGALGVLGVQGGPSSAAQAYLVTAPLAFYALVPDGVRLLALASGATVVTAAWVRIALGSGVDEAALNALRALASGVVAVLGAVSAQKIRRAEIALAEERARALEALERSEKRQAVVERLAAAGSRAAGVAHDMSNPLASMRCNLDWLREAADAGRLAAEGAEVAQVIQETRECLERLGQNLQEFRSVARTARALALKVDELAGDTAPVRSVKDLGAGEPAGPATPKPRASGE